MQLLGFGAAVTDSETREKGVVADALRARRKAIKETLAEQTRKSKCAKKCGSVSICVAESGATITLALFTHGAYGYQRTCQ
jgi:hypothetical protein